MDSKYQARVVEDLYKQARDFALCAHVGTFRRQKLTPAGRRTYERLADEKRAEAARAHRALLRTLASTSAL